jgi:hypothetical protein
MEPEVSLSFSQKPTTGPYVEKHESSPHHHNPFTGKTQKKNSSVPIIRFSKYIQRTWKNPSQNKGEEVMILHVGGIK